MENNLEMQEIHCHSCDMYVQFPIDKSLDGNHTLKCPNCGHEHYRVVKNGVITSERWNSSGPTINVTNVTYTTVSVYDSTGWGSGTIGTGGLWASSTSVTDYYTTAS